MITILSQYVYLWSM